jgi:hypothetical protein
MPSKSCKSLCTVGLTAVAKTCLMYVVLAIVAVLQFSTCVLIASLLCLLARWLCDTQTFYKDPARYAYTFQSFAFITRLMEQQKPQKKLIRILERSALSDYCFARNCYETGLMNEVEWAAYEEWWSFFSRSMPGGPNGIVYLYTTPEVCT